MNRINNFLYRLLHPTFWLQNYPSDESVDILLNVMMDADAPVKVGEHETQIGDLRIWTSNWPYAYGRVQGMGDPMPFPLTRVRLRKYIARKVAEREIEKMRGAAA